MKKLDMKQLMNVSGGLPEDFAAYMDQMSEKYGLTPGDYKSLEDRMTEEEWDTAGDLFWKGVDFSDFPGL